MSACEVVREWEMAWLQSDDRVRGDHPLRLAGEKTIFTATLERTKRVDFSETLRKAGVSEGR